ncbi:Uncharacterized protein BP5553_01438 [Venustampulla echinocandica]|uniref:Endoplasmic reticulum junction formation protein lunapark n=1 Tax=Venustampulla echinocandica TaxID=2656787 RepID=A0A370U101_9HELO|nr:Uncharacterized protein BP5553_01438 [Venustampulla echinocandica]RDL41459.1 Uncharacterized protein BP5553_01438 [Venustampulla echinocandica]
MVSLWPWKGEDTSPASFEKALSALATKISKSQAQLDSLRQRGRRLKGLWTLYAVFAYLLCFIILFIVVGWRNWTAVEYTAVAGSPLLIYVVRKGITSYYNLRVDNATHRLEDQQAERAKTIERLKAATKYNSTQELLEKYAATPAPPKPKKPRNTSKSPKGRSPQLGRIRAGPPPPTANIQRPGQIQGPLSSQPSTPQPQPRKDIPLQFSPAPVQASPQGGNAEFAPNAFPSPPQYAHGGESNAGGHWYDRVLDLLLGDDETSPKNRMALICSNCRLVNGQAPPGTKSPAELGKWRCFGCGAWNGEEDEAVKVVQEMKERIEKDRPGSVDGATSSGDERPHERDVAEEDIKEKNSDEAGEVESSEESIKAKPKRGRPKRGKGSS